MLHLNISVHDVYTECFNPFPFATAARNITDAEEGVDEVSKYSTFYVRAVT